MLVDIVAKNGNLLLNFTQRPDGTLDDECLAILADMAAWNTVNGEGITGTRPWGPGLEGEVNAPQERFREVELEWQPTDFRFTCKGKTVYAFQMGWPEDGPAGRRTALVKTFASGTGTGGYRLALADVVAVELLGHGPVAFELGREGLQISGLPETRPVQCAHCFKIVTR
jgi:alpha-L-fucosidase